MKISRLCDSIDNVTARFCFATERGGIMKRKIFGAVIAAVIGISCFVGSGCILDQLGSVTGGGGNDGADGEHYHTYSKEWTTSETEHWHASTCGHDVKNGLATHADADKDGKCDTCKKTMTTGGTPDAPDPDEPGTPHEHTYDTGWTTSETEHWHAATCGHDVKNGLAAHADSDNDGKCDTCKKTTSTGDNPNPGGDTHEHTYSTAWTNDANGHWHAATCGHTSEKSALESHADTNGDFICDKCEYVIHTHTPALAWDKDASGHWHATTCGHNVKLSFAAHTSANAEGKCNTCGYQISEPKPHVHTYAETWTSDADGHWHASTCGHPAEISEAGDHVDADKNGKCDVCERAVPIPETPHTEHTYVNDICTGCGDVRPSSGNELAVTLARTASECAFFEWDDTNAAAAKAYYRLNGATSWTAVDAPLIRQYDENGKKYARVDIVGLKGGAKYDFKLQSSGNKVRELLNMTVESYDRSGFAHFKATSGVGAYNNDGTPKNGAVVVYVTEATKNTVKATIGGKTYTGIVSILQNAGSGGLIVRLVGTVGAATWNKLTYGSGKITWDKVKSADGTKTLINDIGANASKISQADLIKNGYNTLNTSKYAELNGLTSFINKDSSKKEFDSCWNNCAISGVQNVTLEGIGEDAMIFQWGLTWSKCKSIEVRNITFDDYTEDACSFEAKQTIDENAISSHESTRLWFHNNTINEGINYWDVCNEQDKHEGDGGTDLKGVTNVTISYNHYYLNHKTGLVGANDSSETANVTFHHNYYESCVSRLPLARQANMHMYNNYYKGSTGTNMSLRSNAYAFIENCYFDNAKNAIVVQNDSGYGYAKLYNNTYTGESKQPTDSQLVTVTSRTATVTNTNKFGQSFDTDANAFYYDATNKRSDVTSMLKTEFVPSIVPKLAGVLGDNNKTHEKVDLTGKESISTAPTTPEQPTTPVEPHTHEASASAQWITSETRHWKECSANDGGKVNDETHTAANAEGKCATCGYQISTPSTPPVSSDTKVSYLADTLATDTIIAAATGVTNALFTFKSDDDFTCSPGKNNAITDASKSPVKVTLLDGTEHTFTKGLKCTATAAATTTDTTVVDTSSFTVTANKKIKIRVFVGVSNDSFNSDRAHTITYSVAQNTPTVTKQSTERQTLEVIEITLEAGEVLTVTGNNYATSTAKIWLFGIEAIAL